MATIYRYDIANDSWSQDPVSMPQAISGASSCTIAPNQFVLIGGYDKTRNKGLDTAWLFDCTHYNHNNWHLSPRWKLFWVASVCDKQGHAMWYVGRNNPVHHTRDFWKLSRHTGLKTNWINRIMSCEPKKTFYTVDMGSSLTLKVIYLWYIWSMDEPQCTYSRIVVGNFHDEYDSITVVYCTR